MSYKVTNEELDATINDWPAAWWELVSANEVSVGPLVDAPDDLVRRVDQQSHYEFNGESSTETQRHNAFLRR